MLAISRIASADAVSSPPLRVLARYASDIVSLSSPATMSTLSSSTSTSSTQRQSIPNDGLDLSHFINQARGGAEQLNMSLPSTSSSVDNMSGMPVPQKRVFIETYGCQMNVNDSEVVNSVLRDAGFTSAPSAEAADVVLINTCAIRDNAESKIWQRLGYFKNLKISRKAAAKKAAKLANSLESNTSDRIPTGTITPAIGPVVGVLGCMAERLKHRLLESEKMVDLVAGPDAYRDLPRLINIVEGSGSSGSAIETAQMSSSVVEYSPLVEIKEGEKTESGAASPVLPKAVVGLSTKDRNSISHGSIHQNTAINVQLSLDETYADVVPVRPSGARSVFLSIMRGCNNMCAFCVVPFTRGRERSRPSQSILDEVS